MGWVIVICIIIGLYVASFLLMHIDCMRTKKYLDEIKDYIVVGQCFYSVPNTTDFNKSDLFSKCNHPTFYRVLDICNNYIVVKYIDSDMGYAKTKTLSTTQLYQLKCYPILRDKISIIEKYPISTRPNMVERYNRVKC